MATKPFSKDFYKLVSGSSKSLQSHGVTVDSDDEEADAEEDADDDRRILGTKERKRLTRNRSNISPSMSEAGLVQLVTCSSSSDSDTRSTVEICLKKDEKTTNVKDIDVVRSPVRSQIPCSSWRRSNGWKRVNTAPEVCLLLSYLVGTLKNNNKLLIYSSRRSQSQAELQRKLPQ